MGSGGDVRGVGNARWWLLSQVVELTRNQGREMGKLKSFMGSFALDIESNAPSALLWLLLLRL